MRISVVVMGLWAQKKNTYGRDSNAQEKYENISFDRLYSLNFAHKLSIMAIGRVMDLNANLYQRQCFSWPGKTELTFYDLQTFYQPQVVGKIGSEIE